MLHGTSRWVINFHNWPLERSATGSWLNASAAEKDVWHRSGRVPRDYPEKVANDFVDCLEIVRTKVKPEREKVTFSKSAREKWWIYERARPELYSTVKTLSHFLVHPLTSKFNCLVFSGHGVVVSHMTVVLAFEDWPHYAVLQSDLHWQWVLVYGNKLETRPQYTPSDVFETFPFPMLSTAPLLSLSDTGKNYYQHRREVTMTRQEGLTKTYNRFHDRGEKSEDIARLRALHVELDQAVAAAYGWSGLDLGHGFHATKQGERYTLSEPARRTVLDRLLQLNHQRYEEEVKAGLHEKKKSKVRGPKSKAESAVPAQGELIQPPQAELFG